MILNRTGRNDFHAMPIQSPGLLIPLYIYPANIHTNVDFNRVIDFKRRSPSVPFWVILNPATGPGEAVDANYVKAIDRLQGAGCIVLAYVTANSAWVEYNTPLAHRCSIACGQIGIVSDGLFRSGPYH